MSDTALELRKKVDAGLLLSDDTIGELLDASLLVRDLTAEGVSKPLAMVWRLIALSEIPYAERLPYTRDLITRVVEELGCEMGFSLSGDAKMFLPCYNSMLLSAFCRLGMHEHPLVQKGVQWIIGNQPFSRNKPIQSLGKLSFDRYGGCFKNTPCYIGIVKATHALVTYNRSVTDSAVQAKAAEGIEYILSHALFKRKSTGTPITKHMLDLSFPESYHTNIVDLLRLMVIAGVDRDPRMSEAVAYVKGKVLADNRWRVSFRYKADGYRVFDKGRQPAEWLSYILKSFLEILAV